MHSRLGDFVNNNNSPACTSRALKSAAKLTAMAIGATLIISLFAAPSLPARANEVQTQQSASSESRDTTGNRVDGSANGANVNTNTLRTYSLSGLDPVFLSNQYVLRYPNYGLNLVGKVTGTVTVPGHPENMLPRTRVAQDLDIKVNFSFTQESLTKFFEDSKADGFYILPYIQPHGGNPIWGKIESQSTEGKEDKATDADQSIDYKKVKEKRLDEEANANEFTNSEFNIKKGENKSLSATISITLPHTLIAPGRKILPAALVPSLSAFGVWNSDSTTTGPFFFLTVYLVRTLPSF